MAKRGIDLSISAEAFDNAKSDYAAASPSRYRRNRTGLLASGSGADYHFRNESAYFRMMEYARDFDRNDAIVGTFVDRAVTNIIQQGFSLDVDTGDDGLDDELENRWQEWSTDPNQCDHACERTFSQMEKMVQRAQLVDGDHLALPLKEGSIQLIEGHRIRTATNSSKNVVLGVLVDERGRHAEFWLTKKEIDPFRSVSKVSDIVRYPTFDDQGIRQVHHVYSPKRVSQTRGVTAFAPIFDHLGMYEDINFARLVQQQIVSCFAVFRMKELGTDAAPPSQKGEQTTESLSDGSTRIIEGIAPGMEIEGRPGEKLQGFTPAVPNPEFFDHMRSILQVIGINFGLPLVTALMDASETNFSGWRGAVDAARMGLRDNQHNLSQQFHQPIYRWKVRQWMADDVAIQRVAAKRKVNVFRHTWNPPTLPYVDPYKDAQADDFRMRNGLSARRAVYGENGRDYFKHNDNLVADIKYAIRNAKQACIEINEEFPNDPDKCHWRDFYPYGSPDGQSVDTVDPANPSLKPEKPKTPPKNRPLLPVTASDDSQESKGAPE